MIIKKQHNDKHHARINKQIRSREVRLVNENNEQEGIVLIEDALQKAKEAELDLVEVAPNANPPVCRIMDYGKYLYELTKKEKIAKKKQHSASLKEIQVRPRIFEHDLEIKISHAKKFFAKKHKVKFVLRYRGREMQHYDEGKELLKFIENQLDGIAKPEHDPKFEPRRISQIFAPCKSQKKTKEE